MCRLLELVILLFPLILCFPSLPPPTPPALQLALCPPLLSLLVSPGSCEQRTRTGRTLHVHLDLHAFRAPNASHVDAFLSVKYE